MPAVKAFAANKQGGALEPFEYELSDIGPEEVDLKVEYCGVCHSDVAMIDNEWGFSSYPIVPGHEVIGRVTGVGDSVVGLKEGQLVGVGWFTKSCMRCMSCLDGNHNMCPTAESTIIGRNGGFADRLRCHWSWATPIPEDVNPESAGPLFCGGLTVFNPILEFDVRPTDHVGVVGIGGLGHLALQFLGKWGCEVTAFTSTESKAEQAKKFGATRIVNSRDSAAIQKAADSLDFILVTAQAKLDWQNYLNALRAKGRLHIVSGIVEPIPVAAFGLIGRQRSVSGSPLGSPATARKMLDFCGRHAIAPQVEEFPMSKINDAMEHLRAGKARYRVVLKNDF